MNDQDPADGAAPLVGASESSPPDPAAEEQIWAGTPTLWARAGLALASLGGGLALAILAAVTGWVWLGWINRGLIPASVLFAGFTCLYPRMANAYRLTTQRLFVRRGWLNRTTDQIELIRVDDIRVRQGLLQRFLRVGDVVVLSTDATDQVCVLRGIRNAEDVGEKVREHTRRMRKKSLFVEGL